MLFCYVDESQGWTEVITESNTVTASHVTDLLSSSTAEKGSIYRQHICLSICCLFAVFIIVMKLVFAKYVVIGTVVLDQLHCNCVFFSQSGWAATLPAIECTHCRSSFLHLGSVLCRWLIDQTLSY